MAQDNKKDLPLSKWEENLLGMPLSVLPRVIPGLAAVAAVTWLSIWLAGIIGEDWLGFQKSPISPVMIAIILGLFLGSLLALPEILLPGIKFSVKKLLRLGIIFLGIRLTIFDVFKLGAVGVPIVALCILGSLVFTAWLNTRLSLPRRLGTLIAVGTSICGVTAIVATSPVIDANDEESAYAVAVITVFGLFATLVYPYLAEVIFSGSAMKVGLFLGTSVHETAQVVGAAKIYADIFSRPTALDIATVAKLVRNVFMILVIPYLAYRYSRQSISGHESAGRELNPLGMFPKFILGFLAVAAIRSLGDAGINAGNYALFLWPAESWLSLIAGIKSAAEVLLVVALAGVGLGTDVRSLKALGIKPFLVGLGASLAVGLVSFLAITLLGGMIAL